MKLRMLLTVALLMLATGRDGADLAHRACRGPRSARPDAGAHLCRPHRLRLALRQARRHQPRARHRARSSRPSWQWVDDNKGLVMKLRQGVKFQDGDAVRRRRGQVQHRAPPDAARLEPQGRDQRGEVGRGRRRPHGQAGAVAAVRAAAGAALTDRAGMIVSPKAAKAEGDDFAEPSGLRRPLQIRRAGRAGPHRARTLRRLLEQGRDPFRHASCFCRSSDSTVRLANLQSGSARPDRARRRDRSRRRAQGHAGSNSRRSPALAYQGITINLNNGDRAKNPLGQDPRVREALELSIDRAALNQVVFNGEFQPGNQWEPPGNQYYVKDLPVPGARRRQGQGAARRRRHAASCRSS